MKRKIIDWILTIVLVLCSSYVLFYVGAMIYWVIKYENIYR